MLTGGPCRGKTTGQAKLATFFENVISGVVEHLPAEIFKKKVAILACPVVLPPQGPPVNTNFYTLREG